MKKAFSILLIVFSAMMLIHCAYADITESLIYDEAGNSWTAGDEDLTELVSIMKRECTKSPMIKGTYMGKQFKRTAERHFYRPERKFLEKFHFIFFCYAFVTFDVL